MLSNKHSFSCMFTGLILSTQQFYAHISKKQPVRCSYVNLRRRIIQKHSNAHVLPITKIVP